MRSDGTSLSTLVKTESCIDAPCWQEMVAELASRVPSGSLEPARTVTLMVPDVPSIRFPRVQQLFVPWSGAGSEEINCVLVS